MFKKFTRESIGQQSQVKQSQVRTIRTSIITQHPEIEPYLDLIMPKKNPLVVAKSNTVRCTLIIVNKEIVFVEMNGKYFPTLRVLHKYPFILPKVRVDTGAIKFVMGGANVMCPGMTSAGGDLSTDFQENDIVGIMAEGKTHCLGIGLAKMSRDDIVSINKGHGLENIHFIGDPLWELKEINSV